MLNNGNKDYNDDNRIIRISKLIIIEDENYFEIMNGIEFDHGKL
jgi:hypothetical protein